MPSATSTTPPHPVDRAGRSLRILYAEDMPELRDLVVLVLSRDGHAVETVPDGAEAFARLRNAEANFDLLITDHHMPLMNGLELVQQIRGGGAGFGGKILVFSSEVSPSIRDQYRQLGVDRMLPKPVFPSALREALQQLFETPA